MTPRFSPWTILVVSVVGCGAPAHKPFEVTTARPADSLVIVDGISAPVQIVTDPAGIPHIRAESLDDLYFAWGYVTARERLWQIAHNRAAARGERWKWMGNATLQSDGAAQLLQFADFAASMWAREKSDPRIGPPLEAYTRGINAWIERCERGEAAWPVEFERLNARPDPWMPEDSALLIWSLGVLLDLDLSELRERNRVNEIGRDGVAHRRRFEDREMYPTIPDEAARELWPQETAAAAVERSAPEPSANLLADATAGIRELRAAFGRRNEEAHASNVFAVGGARSAGRKPMLANDMHLGLSVPSAVMLVHVTVPGVVDAAGAFPPGLPLIVSGRNERVAWGITSLAADMLDVYADSISADKRSVQGPDGEWHAVVEKPFDMKFKLLGIPLPSFGQTRRYGPHGPILIWDDKQHIAYGVRWTALTDTLSITQLIGIERAGSAAELEARYATLVTPGISMIATDVDGDLRYRSLGALPRRSQDFGRGPHHGDGREEWLGVIAREENPAWAAPPDGFIVNCNNLPVGSAYPYPLPRYEWGHDRARRIAELIKAHGRLNAADMRAIQNDVHSLRASRFLPAMLACADSLPGEHTPRMREALAILHAWDSATERDAIGPTLFWAWYRTLQQRSELRGLPGLTLAALRGEAPEALHVPDSNEPEGAARAAIASLEETLVALEDLLGPEVSEWTYASAHLATFNHPMADDDRNSDLEPPRTPVDGDGGTPVAGQSRLPGSSDVTHTPVMRHVVDLAVPDSSWAVIVPGNSGNHRSPHATDHIAPWADHEYFVLHMRWDRIETLGGAQTRLTPR